MSRPPRIDAPSAGDTIRLSIHDVTVGGSGVGRTVEGFVLFVPGALPGDVVEARVERVRRGHGEAALVRTLSISPERREAPCPVQSRCGGCALMPLDERAQLELKAKHLVETLRRVGGLTIEPDALVESPHALGYRNRVRFAVAARAQRPLVGFRPRGRGDEHVAVERCLLAPDEVTTLAERWLTRLDEESPGDAPWPSEVSVRRSRATGESVLVLHGPPGTWPVAAHGARAFVEEEPLVAGIVRVIEERGRIRARHVLAGASEVVEKIGRFDVPLDATSFQQVNPAAAEKLYEEAATTLCRAARPTRLLDLFCGAGLAGLHAAREDAEVIGVESDPRSLSLAQRVAESVGARARFFLGDAVRVAREMAVAGESFDALIANPPRRGAGAELGAHARALGVRSAVLVSCHAATLARDAAGFVDAGYRPTRLVAVDLFPQTPHLEAVLGWELP